MFDLKVENMKGSILTLTQNESNYQVFDIQGLNPPKAQLNTSEIAGKDGSKFNSSKLEARNIVIYIKLNGDIEANRLHLNSFFITGQWCKIYYKNSSRDVYIEGYVESNEYTSFSNNEIMQISILCPDSYFKSMQELIDDISKALAAFEFPFSINSDAPIPISTLDTSKVTNVTNDSEGETGVIVEIDVLASVNKIQIRSVSNGDTMTLNYPFVANDRIIIDTNKGEKSITLIREGVKYNIFSSMQKNSTFFQLQVGDNHFSYLIDDGSSDELVYVRFRHYKLYRGV